MRADRLVATLLLMQTKGRVTAAELAAELEISVATARRDLAALSTAGVPVYPQPGRGGGWSLVGGARTDLSGLTASEATALFLLVGPSSTVAPELRSALRKLAGALPQPFRSEASAAASAVVFDPARWGESTPDRPAFVELLQDAVVRRRQVEISYTGRTGTRLIDPWGLVDKDNVWYLIAGTERGQRTFRVDRISEARCTEQPAHRPADFELNQAWRAVVDEVEQRRSSVTAVVLVPANRLDVLRTQFGRYLEVDEELSDDRLRVRISAHLPVAVAEQLAGWGAAIDVLEPESVRSELARIGTELAERYSPPR
ncbi:putative DNA-binding transcriptional regulator YafY [Tamaricihabitans halophyticus]|uniref:Putative DNA-binding transcriptional regulator YafY n=1 Tax=Tamaricihabitans halophyticus TaxID=1262583 RepID=A0A4R2QFR2_9PSEU|nr:YafY family protein [Tamaricihabitans halophyticus]TCP47364.1 putative DNA-binding transcriptional regulator YafY [Tamaricihabitans halophyticus]